MFSFSKLFNILRKQRRLNIIQIFSTYLESVLDAQFQMRKLYIQILTLDVSVFRLSYKASLIILNTTVATKRLLRKSITQKREVLIVSLIRILINKCAEKRKFLRE